MFINHIFYQTRFLDTIKKSLITNRVKIYFQDLYERYRFQSPIDFSQSVFNHQEQGDQLFKEASQRFDLSAVDMILFPVWSTTLNMEYAVPELHWKNKYALAAQFQDVRDCGSLCVFYAMHLLLKLNKVDVVSQALCCSIENALVVNKKINNVITPAIDYGAFIYFSSTSDFSCSLEIVMSEIFDINKINSSITFNTLLKNILRQYSDFSDDYFIYKRKNYEDHKNQSSIEMLYPATSGFVYFCLESIVKNIKNIKYKYVFIIDYDESQETMGILLLKIKQEN